VCRVRIVYVLTSLGIGGAERQVLALGERMSRRGHAVALLVLRPRIAEEWPTALDLVHLDMRKTPLSVLASVARGHEFLGAFRPEIVHSHGFHGNMAARFFRFVDASPAPISTIHNVYEGGWMRMSAYRLTDSLCALTTAVSHAAAERFVQFKAVPQSRCRVIANAIDIDEFVPDTARRARMRSEMNAASSFVWLTAGRIVPAKDYPNLLRAFAQLRSIDAATSLWIAGEGSEDEVARLRALSKESGIGDAVRWLGLRRDLPALLDAADGFVLGSAWEGMPLAVGEAMAMEKPLVATDVGGVRELVGEAGVLVPPKDALALAAAMLGLMRKPSEERREMGCIARLRISEQFSLDAKAEEWETLYREASARGF
jgi:glycosyltransferase involved in cell wall biosynthesis